MFLSLNDFENKTAYVSLLQVFQVAQVVYLPLDRAGPGRYTLMTLTNCLALFDNLKSKFILLKQNVSAVLSWLSSLRAWKGNDQVK